MPDGPICAYCFNRLEVCQCKSDDGSDKVFMPKPVQPPASWQQGYMEGRAEAQKTLRDEFAMAALPAIIGGEVAKQAFHNYSDYAEAAYKFADAMLAEREKGGDS